MGRRGKQRSATETQVFADDPGDSTRVKCMPCSVKAGKDVSLAKASVSGHRRGLAHMRVMQEQTATSDPQQCELEPSSSGVDRSRIVELSETDIFMDQPPNPDTIEPMDVSMNPADEYDSHWWDDEGNPINVAVEKDPISEIARALRIQLGDLDAHFPAGLFTAEDEPEDLTIPNSGFSEPDGLDDNDRGGDDIDDPCWFPYGSKSMYYLDLLDNLPRLRLSDDHLKVIIWVMKKCGALNIPSFKALRKRQASMKCRIIEPRRHVSALGHQFYMNHPVDLLKLDWANPLVRKHIRLYPELTDTITESWQADKWLKEVSDDELTPMWAAWKISPHRHFYVREVAQLKSGEFVLPLRWVTANNEDCLQGHCVVFDGIDTFTIDDELVHLIPCANLNFNFVDLTLAWGDLVLRAGNNVIPMPHPVRAIANGRPAFCIRVMPWVDDVSGNRSKQYNAHMNIYLANVSIPHKKLTQEYYVRFCSTSPEASGTEQLDAMGQDLQSETWSEAYDCLLDDVIIFKVFGHLFAADNPQQAELASTSSSKSRYWCRSDMSGGTQSVRESDAGYKALYQLPESRKPSSTVKKIHDILLAACTGVQATVDRTQTESGVKDKTTTHWVEQLIPMARAQVDQRIKSEKTRDPILNRRLRKGERARIKLDIKHNIQLNAFKWVLSQPADRYAALPPDSPLRQQLRPGDHYNTLLGIKGIDPHADTPCEILHTFLLGIVKYLWYETSNAWKKHDDKLFANRLQYSNLNGLSIPSIRAKYIVQYKNSLIGRHFRTILQLGIFHITPDLSLGQSSTPKDKFTKLLTLWRATGELAALIWFPEIRNIEEYIADVRICVNNVLDSWGLFDPARITYKYKLHVLLHLERDIRRFGPPILVLSNHQAPSRDIANTLADMERFKHIVSGGWWLLGDKWVQAGASVRSSLTEDSGLQRRLGLKTLSTPLVSGQTVPVPRIRRNVFALASVLDREDPSLGICASVAEYVTLRCEKEDAWVDCQEVISHSLDKCKPGSWVFYKWQPASTVPLRVHVGQITRIMSPSTTSDTNLVLIDRYTVASTKDATLNMPVLSADGTRDVTSAQAIQFDMNVQHVERHPKDLPSISIFVINTHSLHNPHLIRHALPRWLIAPKIISQDRVAVQSTLAAAIQANKALQESQPPDPT